MLAMSLSLFHFIGLFLLGFLLPACNAFEFDLPSSIPTNEPITVGYRMKFDGSDETRWLMNITDVDGSNPEILNDGEIFKSTGFRGAIQVTIDREGPFRLKAVNPDFLSQGYATSSPGFAIDFDSDDPTNEGSGTESPGNDGDTDGDGTDDGTGGDSDGSGNGDGADEGTGDSDGDGDGEGAGEGGTGSGSDDDPEDEDTTSASPKSSNSSATASPRPSSNLPNAPIGASKQGANTGLIAGCIAAGVAVLLIILAVLFWFRRAKNRGKPGRPLTFYRDRMIRAPTPPPNEGPPPPVRISEPMSVVQNPHDYGHAGMAYLPGYGNTYPYGQPQSASTAVGPPVMREFILRSPRMPASPSQGQPALKEFILRSPRPGRESLAYSKP
jgi:hypothetical protein